MIGITVIACLMVLALAWANGANDVAKGVATLAGSGVTHARRAIFWGAFCSVLGGLAAVLWGAALVDTFSRGFVSASFPLTLNFVISAVSGAALWVLLATRLRLPVSTTHGLLGGIVGAALATMGPEGLRLGAVANKALLPLLLSPLIAILLCVGLLWIMRRVERRLPAWTPGCCAREDWEENPYTCAPGKPTTNPALKTAVQKFWVALHWLSGGVTSFARGLNDVPKIAALLMPALALLPQTALASGYTRLGPIIAVALVMGLGSLWGGFRILPVLAQGVTRMDVSSGLMANVGTSTLVLFASPLGLPVSTTHVSTGSLMGIRWGDKAAPRHGDVLKLILFGWLVTLPIAALIAASASGLLNLSGLL